MERDLQDVYPSYLWRDTESEATESEFGALFPRECTKGTSQKLASILGEADDTTDAMRMVTGMRATYGSLTTGMDRGRASNAAPPPPAQSKPRNPFTDEAQPCHKSVPPLVAVETRRPFHESPREGREGPPPPCETHEFVAPTGGGHHDPQPLTESCEINSAPDQCGSLTGATSQSPFRTLQQSPAPPVHSSCHDRCAQPLNRRLPVTGVPDKFAQQPFPLQSQPQVVPPQMPSSPLTAQNLAQLSASVQPQLAELSRSKTLEVLRNQSTSHRHGIQMHNTMLARLSKDDLRDENAQLKSEIVALRMEISKRRAGIAQSEVSCTSHQVRQLIA